MAATSQATERAAQGSTTTTLPFISGPKLAFTVDFSNVVVMSLDGTRSYVALRGGRCATSCQAESWSPDGTNLALSVYDQASGQARIAILDVRTGGVVFGPRVSLGNIAWSPDGQQIAVFQPWRVSVMRPDFSDLHQIASWNTSTPFLAWSPDSSTVAYIDGEHLWAVSRSGQNAHALSAIDAYWPSWSPDGSRLVFGGGGGGVYAVDADGGNLQQLSSSAYLPMYGAAWSPAGSWIALRGPGQTSNIGLYVIAPTGGEPRAVPAPNFWDGNWTSDGTEIGFLSDADPGSRTGSRAIEIIRPDGTGLRTLYSTSGVIEAAPVFSGR